MTNLFLPSAKAFATPTDDDKPADTASRAGYTCSVKNGQHHARRWASGAMMAAAVALATGPAMAADPPPEPAPTPEEAIAQLREVAEQIAAQMLVAAGVAAQPADALPPADAKAPKDAKKARGPGPEAKAQRGVVTLLRGGQPLGLGTVLANDGRILTALSSLGAGNDIEAKFADGTTVPVRLGHHDRTWDLALVVPQSGKWQEGLSASTRDPIRPDATIRSFSSSRGKLAPTEMVLRSHRSLIGGDDKALLDAIEIASRVTPGDLGSPIIDEDGAVVGLLGRACAPNEGRPCTPVAFGVPVTAIKSFLQNVPASAVQPAPWLGIQGVPEVGQVAKGVRVLVVHPESPAEVAKLHGGDRSRADTILAVDGVPVTSPESLTDVMKTHGVGESVPLLVFGDGKYRTVTVQLKAAPDGSEHPAELPPAPEQKSQVRSSRAKHAR